jgi:hypothetical protein
MSQTHCYATGTVTLPWKCNMVHRSCYQGNPTCNNINFENCQNIYGHIFKIIKFSKFLVELFKNFGSFSKLENPIFFIYKIWKLLGTFSIFWEHFQNSHVLKISMFSKFWGNFSKFLRHIFKTKNFQNWKIFKFIGIFFKCLGKKKIFGHIQNVKI